MVTATDDKAVGLDFPQARTPGQEAGQEILASAILYLRSDKSPEDRVILATDTTHALWELVRAHKDDDETDPEDLQAIQACIALLVDRVIGEAHLLGGMTDRTGTLLNRFSHMLHPGSWYTAGIARKTMPELLGEEVQA